mmetsp:Transcript_15493/g.30017  ORF Transcript_15493/g.30017 Transcript_15493/m.30017 type:complete len:85 (-) Transcript_15493:334-588(-)
MRSLQVHEAARDGGGPSWHRCTAMTGVFVIRGMRKPLRIGDALHKDSGSLRFVLGRCLIQADLALQQKPRREVVLVVNLNSLRK